MLPENGGVDRQKIIDGFARLQKVDECLHRHSRMCEARRSVYDILIDRHHTRKRVLLLCRHRCFYDTRSAMEGQIAGELVSPSPSREWCSMPETDGQPEASKAVKKESRMLKPLAAAILSLLPPTLCAQSFNVASIKPCTAADATAPLVPGGRSGGGTLSTSPGRFRIHCMSLQDLIRMAYTSDDPLLNGGGLSDTRQVMGGPSWAHSDSYSIEAVTDNPVANGSGNRLNTPGSMIMRGPMLRALLEDRFQVKVHRAVEEVSMYALVLAKGGLKLQPLGPGDRVVHDPLKPLTPAEFAGPKPVCSTIIGDTHGPNRTIHVTNSLAAFAQALSVRVDRRVIDQTDITGTFDFHLEYAPDENTPGLPGAPNVSQSSDISPAGSIFTALERQLGLKLVPIKGHHGYIVIDHADRPSQN